jgi:hypothetical protein
VVATIGRCCRFAPLPEGIGLGHRRRERPGTRVLSGTGERNNGSTGPPERPSAAPSQAPTCAQTRHSSSMHGQEKGSQRGCRAQPGSERVLPPGALRELRRQSPVEATTVGPTDRTTRDTTPEGRSHQGVPRRAGTPASPGGPASWPPSLSSGRGRAPRCLRVAARKFCALRAEPAHCASADRPENTIFTSELASSTPHNPSRGRSVTTDYGTEPLALDTPEVIAARQPPCERSCGCGDTIAAS